MPNKPKSLPIRTLFPPPWSAEKSPSGYQVVAANGKLVAAIYEEDEPIRRGILNCPTVAEARSIVNAIVMLPDLMTKREGSKS